MDDKITSLTALPWKSRPAYSLALCVTELAEIIEDVAHKLRPSFIRRLLGGVSRDHARAVTATVNGDVAAIVKIVTKIQDAAMDLALSNDKSARNDGNALFGYCERVTAECIKWREDASEFEANIFGSDKRLLERSTKVSTIMSALTRPLEAIAARRG